MSDPTARGVVHGWLERAGYEVVAESALSALGAVDRFDAVFAEVVELDELASAADRTTVVRVLSEGDSEASVADPSAYEVLERPLFPHAVLAALRRATERTRLRRRVAELEQGGQGDGEIAGLIGQSEGMRELARQVERVRDSDIAVALFGASGTGKEVVARAIHRGGRRADGPFVVINCAAIPEGLHESELFGQERAPGGGVQPGRLEQARGGTIFLDEVGEMSPLTQASLQRALQERSIRRVGGIREIPVDARIICGTRKNLEEEVKAGRFREDLYFRLVVYPLRLPRLRDRREDIPRLVSHFLTAFAGDVRNAPTRVAPAALDALADYDWPGNVRELENVVHRAMLSSEGEVIEPRDLPAEIASSAPPVASEAEIVPMRELEKRAIQQALGATGGSVEKAAKLLGMGRATLYRRLAKYDDLKAE